MTENEKIEIVKNALSINDASLKLYGYCNQSSKNKIIKLSEEHNIDISHYSRGAKQRKYEIIKKICPICEIEFETKKNYRDEKTTCSSACSNLYFQHGKNNPNFDKEKYKERWEKVSKTLLKKEKVINKVINKVKEPKFCKFCKIDISNKAKKNKYCSNICSSKDRTSEVHNKIKQSQLKRVEEGTHKGWNPRNVISYPEKFFMKVLENNNINYKHNYTVYQKDLGLETNYYYYIDFYIEELNIGLEIDGKQHNYRIEHDEKRDTALTNNGYKMYRIKWKSINNQSGKDYIKSEIDNFLNYYNNELKKLNTEV